MDLSARVRGSGPRPGAVPSRRRTRRAGRSGTTRLTRPSSARLMRVENVREEGQLLGAVQADEPGQEPRGAEVDPKGPAWRRSVRSGPTPTPPPGRSRGPCSGRRPRRCRRPWRWSAWGADGAGGPLPRGRASEGGNGRPAGRPRRWGRRGRHPSRRHPPRPVRTSARSWRSAATSSKVASSSCHMVPVAAFLRSGRFMVTVTTPSRRSTMRVSSVLDIGAAYETGRASGRTLQKASSMTSTSPAMIDTTSKRTSTRSPPGRRGQLGEPAGGEASDAALLGSANRLGTAPEPIARARLDFARTRRCGPRGR